MQPPVVAEDDAPSAPRRVPQWAAAILWPAFLMAGVLEMLVFVVVDPSELHWLDGPALEWSRQAVYTVTFLIFWGVISTAGAMTALLMVEPEDAEGSSARKRWP